MNALDNGTKASFGNSSEAETLGVDGCCGVADAAAAEVISSFNVPTTCANSLTLPREAFFPSFVFFLPSSTEEEEEEEEEDDEEEEELVVLFFFLFSFFFFFFFLSLLVVAFFLL